MRYQVQIIKDFATEVMKKAGLSQEDAEVFVDSLILSEIRGVTSHAITRLKAYSDKINEGQVDGKGKPAVITEAPSTLVVDGNNGPGMIVGIKTMDMCLKKAAETGACFAAINNSTHYGAGGYYAMYAADQNMIGFSICNADPAVVPFGGVKPMLGTNPMSVAIPANRHSDLVLDMATSVVAKGKVNLSEKLGKSIPLGWIIDKTGKPSIDPSDVHTGALLPFGGVKGYAIGLIIDILCSALSGAKNSRQISSFFNCDNPEEFKNIGMFMGAIDISKFVDINVFKERVDEMFDEIKACPPAPGFNEVMIPGEIEDNLRKQNEEKGIELSDKIVQELIGLAAKYNISHPFN
ncbi:MAG: Ldh family oxidoreductase [Clostridia bacterium]